MSTIREVATLAGVSPATVSRVINHDTHYKMTDETRERVWKAIAELNYKPPFTPSEQINSIRRVSTANLSQHNFGCVLNVRGGKYNDPYYMTILSGFEKELHSKGCEVAFIRTNEELLNEELLCSCFNDSLDGVLLMNTLYDRTYNFILGRTNNIVGLDTEHTSIDNVAYDHYEVADIAVRHLVSCGYKRIGFIGGDERYLLSSKRFKGYYSSLHAYGLEFNPDWVICSDWNDELCETRLTHAYANGLLPDAYFAASDLMAMAALRCFYNLGIRVPDDIGIIGLTNIEMSRFSNPPLTTISLPAFDMGRAAADVLINHLNGDRGEPRNITLRSSLIIRSSTKGI